MLGLAAVLVFMAFYYSLFGLIADVALFFNLVLLVAVLSLIGVTLTMPGIAGIVLTLGMAIDANVLICERIREELRNGSTPLAAIRAGYDKAWATILDANVTHLLAALALMTFGSGPITRLRRHAVHRHPHLDVHLGDGDACASPISSTAAASSRACRSAAATHAERLEPWNSFNPNSNIDFLGWRKVSIAISIVLIIVFDRR